MLWNSVSHTGLSWGPRTGMGTFSLSRVVWEAAPASAMWDSRTAVVVAALWGLCCVPAGARACTGYGGTVGSVHFLIWWQWKGILFSNPGRWGSTAMASSFLVFCYLVCLLIAWVRSCCLQNFPSCALLSMCLWACLCKGCCGGWFLFAFARCHPCPPQLELGCHQSL